MRVGAISALVLLFAPLSAAGPVNLYSLKHEMALGQQMALEVERQAKLLDDLTVTEYVNRIGQNIARHADTPFPVVVKVIRSDEVNAFTLPGGHIFVNSGALRVTASEAELASLLAHEIGHVSGRHLTRQATKASLLQASLAPAGAMGGVQGMIARQLATWGMPLGKFHFSRQFEDEADQAGVKLLFAAGYDPEASIDFLERIEAGERRRPGTVARLYESHPVTADRIARVGKAISRLETTTAPLAINTSEYEAVRRRLGKEP